MKKKNIDNNKIIKTGGEIYDYFGDGRASREDENEQWIPLSWLKKHPGYTVDAVLSLLTTQINSILEKKKSSMFPSQKKLLGLLQKKAMSLEELTTKTGLSPDGIRGRISEIRKFGYDIKKINGIYHFIHHLTDTGQNQLISLKKKNKVKKEKDWIRSEEDILRNNIFKIGVKGVIEKKLLDRTEEEITKKAKYMGMILH
ncbi:MAG: hypothetical protein IMZ52_07760 [Actinobacteria bacterium]|nr:hypothetical protein [Actinomycetota bacterium]